MRKNYLKNVNHNPHEISTKSPPILHESNMEAITEQAQGNLVKLKLILGIVLKIVSSAVKGPVRNVRKDYTPILKLAISHVLSKLSPITRLYNAKIKTIILSTSRLILHQDALTPVGKLLTTALVITSAKSSEIAAVIINSVMQWNNSAVQATSMIQYRIVNIFLRIIRPVCNAVTISISTRTIV